MISRWCRIFRSGHHHPAPGRNWHQVNRTADARTYVLSSRASCWSRLRSCLCIPATSSRDRLLTTFFSCLSRSRASRLDLCGTVLTAARPAVPRWSTITIREGPRRMGAKGGKRAQSMFFLPVSSGHCVKVTNVHASSSCKHGRDKPGTRDHVAKYIATGQVVP